MRESYLEKRLRQEIIKLGGLCLKLKDDNYAGFPDRTIILPTGLVCFVELKAPKKSLSTIQKYVHRTLGSLSAAPYIIDSEESLEAFLNDARTRIA